MPIILKNIVENILKENTFFPMRFKHGGVNLEGEAAWKKWKIWMDINRTDPFLYDVLNTIKLQNYKVSQKQMNLFVKWFNKKTR
jgi:hypothetical protein